MNTKRNTVFLVFLGALLAAIAGYAQTAFKADGIVQSTSGGFKFPDDTVQTTAATTFESYISYVVGEHSGSGGSICYFDVPAEKVLSIEKVSGFTGKGNVIYLAVQPDPVGGGTLNSAYRVPRTMKSGRYWYWEADGSVYAGDENIFTDSTLAVRDFRVFVSTDDVGPDDEATGCTITGRLFNVTS